MSSSQNSQKKLTSEATEVLGELEGLESQVASGRQDKSPGAGLCGVAAEALEHGDKEGGGFSGTGAGHGDDVGAGENEWHGLALNRGGDSVPLALDSPVDIGAEA